MPSASPRIAFVTPRYGPNVVGGAETLCRLLAENLAANGVHVEVLTTCAHDHFTWKNELPTGQSLLAGVPVHRFPVSENRVQARWLELHSAIARLERVDYASQVEWMTNSVWSEQLVEASSDIRRYDWVVAIPYLFGTAFWSVAARPDRTCLIPCLHDEPHAWTTVVQDMLRSSRGCLLNSTGEGELLARMAPSASSRIVGVGYEDRALPTPAAVTAFCASHGIAPGYLLYAGRREVAKNVPLLFAHYAAYRRMRPDAPPLALMGSGELPIPDVIADHVVELGFVPADDMAAAYAGASLLIHPSRMESLGMVLLEAWLAGTPALVNAHSVVLRHHCEESGGGLWFRDEDEFCEALELLLGDTASRDSMAEAGRTYTRTRFSWPTVRREFLTALDDWS